MLERLGAGGLITQRLTFSLAVLTQEWWVADDSIKAAFELRWQLERLLKVVRDKLFENCKAVVEFEQFDLWPTLDFA